MKNTLKKKLLVGFSALSILFGSVFGSLSACEETESSSSSKDFSGYAIIKITGKYVLHRNDRMNRDIYTKCWLHISSEYNSVCVENEDGSELAQNTELYLGESLEEFEKNHIEYTDVCEECFPDGLEA